MTKEERKVYMHNYYLENKEYIRRYKKGYYLRNREAIAERRRKKYVTDPVFRQRELERSRRGGQSAK
jgi:hypothetical protein